MREEEISSENKDYPSTADTKLRNKPEDLGEDEDNDEVRMKKRREEEEKYKDNPSSEEIHTPNKKDFPPYTQDEALEEDKEMESKTESERRKGIK